MSQRASVPDSNPLHPAWQPRVEHGRQFRESGRVMWFGKRTSRDVLPSEKGFLELVGRKADLPLRDAIVHFRDLVSADMDWTDSRKVRFRRRAGRVKLAALALTALSTIVLGIPAIPARASIALPMVALVTLLGALEAFFNWRSRWVLMEEAQYRLNRLRDEMDYYLVVTPSAEITKDKLDEFFEEQQAIWSDVSRRWIEFRRLDQPPAGAAGSPTPAPSQT